jgi:hypothetical protein
MKYCCEKMEYQTVPYNERFIAPQDRVVIYHEESRDYGIKLDREYIGYQVSIEYCPWCGSKLPDSLNLEWCEAVKQDLGIEDVDAEEWAKLPEKYKTEQWWREKGL